jgi:SpoVK/Ycf46/Vps4 family AAA+-type ATPase
MRDVAEYIGDPGLDWYVDRIQRYGSDHRTILLLGPTGIGKSTLGRRIARGLNIDGRVLKIASANLGFSAVVDVIDIVKRLRPTVLMIDDVALNERNFGMVEASPHDLALFEELHDHVPLTIVTKMDDREKEENPFAGMRPGRIDEFFRLPFPSPRVREQILLHYLGYASRDVALDGLDITRTTWEDILERTDKMAGAFLAEVARRFAVHGFDTYKREISSVQAQIPAGNRRRRRTATREKSRPAPNKTERGRIAAELEGQLRKQKGDWMVRPEPWGVFVQRMDPKGGKPNVYGGHGDPLMVIGYGWHHGKSRGGPYRGQGKWRRGLLVAGVVKHLTGVTLKVHQRRGL